MIAAMYLRKSRAEESEPVAETLSRHRATLSAFAAKENITVADAYLENDEFDFDDELLPEE